MFGASVMAHRWSLECADARAMLGVTGLCRSGRSSAAVHGLVRFGAHGLRMLPLFHQTPVDLERWRGRHLQIAAIALSVPIMDMHLRIAQHYQERIAAFIHYG